MWNLYWVTSDGYEDCFIVAKNSRTAKLIEKNMNGFNDCDLSVTKIMEVPNELEKIARKNKKEWMKENNLEINKNEDIKPWPWYAYDWLLKKLGAQFREIDSSHEILLKGIVYSRNKYGECSTYSIGGKAIRERHQKLPKYNIDEELSFDFKNSLYSMLGIAMTECHEIEWLFSKSFIFVVSEKQQSKYETLNDFFEGWSKKTMGNLIHSMQEGFDIDNRIKESLELFLSMRNKLVHGISTSEKYSIETNWGQRELISFLYLFLDLCKLIKQVAESCFTASIDFAQKYFSLKEIIPATETNEMSLFFCECFKVKA